MRIRDNISADDRHIAMSATSGKATLRSVLDVVTSVVLIAAASTIVYRNVISDPGRPQAALEVPSEPLSIEGAPTRGSKDAKAVMIVYSDFQCPFCGRFARDVLPEIERRYITTGSVALAFRHLPLPIHAHAVQAAASAECAGRQGRFWEMHDLLFAQNRLDEEILLRLTKSIELLDRGRFDECLKDKAIRERVTASADEAQRLGIRSTPTFFIGKRLENGRVSVSRVLSGTRPVNDFIEQLDATLSGKPASRFRWIPFAG